MKRAVCLSVLLLAACGGAQANRPEPASPPPSSPAYTTGGAAPEGQHTMPDGTTTSGHEHMDHGAGQHVMPDGGAMEGHEHSQGATHVMPDGSVMPGHQHGSAQ